MQNPFERCMKPAHVVQSANGTLANPFLGHECVDELGTILPLTPPVRDGDMRTLIKTKS